MSETNKPAAALERCPFCGGHAVAHTDPDTGIKHAGCADEDCIGFRVAYDFASEELAIAAWNRRATKASAVPEGWKLTRCEDGAIIVQKDGLGGYAAWKDDSNIASSILYHFADELLSAAPAAPLADEAPVRPTQQATPIPNENKDLEQENESQQAAFGPGAAPTSPVQLSIDSPELQEMIATAAWNLIEEGGSVETTFKAVFEGIDAKLTQATQEAERRALKIYDSAIAEGCRWMELWKARAEAADARALKAENQLRLLRVGVDSLVGFGDPKKGDYIARGHVLALLNLEKHE